MPFRRAAYTLIAESRSVSRLRDSSPHLAVHKEFLIGTPAGCTGCLLVYAEFTPYARAAEVDRLMDFNLSCITRRQPCRTKGEIMPAVWKRLEAEQAQEQAISDYCESCTLPLDVLGRDAENAVVAEAVSTRTADRRVVQFRLVERLKRAGFWKPDTLRDVVLMRQREVKPGARVILLYRDYNAKRSKMFLGRCERIEFTPANRSEVQAGIDRDFVAQREAKGLRIR